MGKVLLHVDLNAFFATAEEIRHPELRGKPLAIGGDGRSGIVSTANYVARKYGVHSGQPTFQARSLCRDLVLLPPDFDYYRMMSHSFFGRLRETFPILEMASIDEAYCDATDLLPKKPDPVSFLKSLQDYLLEETGLSCSIGVGATRWLAKMGSDMKKPLGLTIIRKKDISRLLYPLPIESFWGIGKQTSPALRSCGILQIGDLATAIREERPDVKNMLGKFFETAEAWLEGKGDDNVYLQEADPKSISMSETLEKDIYAFEEGSATLRRIVFEVCEKAAIARKVGSTASVVLKDSSFRLHQRSLSFDPPTNSASRLWPIASELASNLFAKLPGTPIRLVGFALSKLEDQAKQTVQMDFWNVGEYEELDKTKLLINDLNRKNRSKEPLFKRASEAPKKKGDGHAD